MDFLRFAAAYGWWHYSGAILALVNLWRDFIWFWTKFFSVPDLFRTWFEPWRRLAEGYGDSFNLKIYAEAFIVNTFMRLLGFIIKSAVLALWLLVVLGTILAGLLALAAWLLLPLIIVLFFISGSHLIIAA